MQAYVNKQEGVKRLATETGAGQWGSALACACQLMGLECMVYMVRVSYDQKPYRRIMMKTYGARRRRQPVDADRGGPSDPRRASRLARQPRHRDLRGRRGRGQARRHQIRARQRAQPRAAAPDDHRPGSEEADGAGRRVPGHPHRLPRRRQQLRRARVPVPAGQAAGGRKKPARDRGRAGRLRESHAGNARVRLRRHGRDDAAADDAHARARRSCRRPCTPAVSATTGRRRSSATCSRRR